MGVDCRLWRRLEAKRWSMLSLCLFTALNRAVGDCVFVYHTLCEGRTKKKTERVRFGVSSNRQGPVPRQKAATSAKDGRHGHRSNCHLPRLLLEILMRLKQERPTRQDFLLVDFYRFL